MLYTKVQYSTSTDCCTPPTYLYMVCNYMESNSVLVADGNTTSAISPTRRGARPKHVWSAESTTKRICLPWSVYILARLPNKHNHRRRGYILKTRAWPLPWWTGICHTKHENGRRSLALLGKHDQAHREQHSNSPASSEAMSPGRCHVSVSIPPPLLLSQPSHQKSVSAYDKWKPNKPSPSSPEPTSWLRLCTWVTTAAALAISASQSSCAFLCFKCPRKEAAQLIFLAASRFSWQPPFENLGLRFCQESTFPAIWKSWEDFVQDFFPIKSETCSDGLGVLWFFFFNLVGRILGKIKIFVQDFDSIKTGVRPTLMHTKNLYENGPNPFFSGFFNLMDTRMVQIRMAKSVWAFRNRTTNGFGAQIRLLQWYESANGFRTRCNYNYIWPMTLLEVKYIMTCQECGGYRQGYGRIEVHSFLLKRRERTLAARSAVLEMLEVKEDRRFGSLDDDSAKVKWMWRVYPRVDYT